jgi:(R,R)-butanediol dehydrogenase/meso-butanediol dehydrogenase/diacetyl reductase
MALRMGADAFVRDDNGAPGEIAERLGGPPDVVFECIGVSAALQRAAGLVRTQGKIVSLGFCMLPDPIFPGICTFRAITIIFSMAYTIHEFHEVLRQLQSGAVDPRPLVTETIGLAALPAMIDSMRKGAAQTKVQVDPWKLEA